MRTFLRRASSIVALCALAFGAVIACALLFGTLLAQAPWQGPKTAVVDQYGNYVFGTGSPAAVKATVGVILALDVASVTTGSTPVNAISAGHATSGGILVTSNAAGICVNELGAAGIATAGSTMCVAQNQPYYVIPTANAVSVNSSASSVAIGGYGFQ